MASCENLIGYLERSGVTRKSFKKKGDSYRLAGNLLRITEQLIRLGNRLLEDEGIFLEGIRSEIIKFYAGKRFQDLPRSSDLESAATDILEIIRSMNSVQRETCSIYYELRKLGRVEIEQLLDIDC